MARGWGRSEEDQAGDKEQAETVRRPLSPRSPEELQRLKKRHSIELSLARIEEQLGNTQYPERRRALESAREQLRRSLAEL